MKEIKQNPFREVEEFYKAGYILTTSCKLIQVEKIIFATKHQGHFLTMYKGQKLCFHARDTKQFLRQIRRWMKKNESV